MIYCDDILVCGKISSSDYGIVSSSAVAVMNFLFLCYNIFSINNKTKNDQLRIYFHRNDDQMNFGEDRFSEELIVTTLVELFKVRFRLF